MKKVKKYVCGEFGFDIEVEVKSDEEIRDKIIEKLLQTPAKDIGLFRIQITE